MIRDRRYSPFYKIVDGIVDELQDMVWPGETSPRRKLKNEQLEKLKYSVEKLIRDSVSIRHSTNQKALASIHLGKDQYKASTYNEMLTYRIHVERCFNGMIELGYLKIEKKGVNTSDGKRYLTRYSATQKMVNLFPNSLGKALPVLIPQAQNINTIRVQQNFKTEVNGKQVERKKLLEYEETSKTKLMKSNLQKINDTINKFWFDLRLDDDDFTAMQVQMLSKPQREQDVDRQLNLARRNLHRVFNDVEMTLGGRFYGGWWQEVPRGYRQYIVMNGKPMVEYDFANLHPRILYAEAGLIPPDDCYSDIYPKCPGWVMPDPDDMRKAVKIALNAMLNATAELKRPPRAFRRKDCNCSWAQLSAAILERHHLIADKFYTGQGLRLQRIDSDIAEYVMLHFAKYNMPILPLHDSFIIRSGYEESLEKVMQEAFQQFVGSTIEINEKKPPHPNKMSDAERLVWSKNQNDGDPESSIITDDIYEFLAYMETGHEKRLSTFLDLGSKV